MYNVFIPEILFDSKDFDKMKTEYNSEYLDTSTAICELSTILNEKTNVVLRTLLGKKGSKKNIFIGAISHDHADMHSTLYGVEDGSIIILNIYYDLYRGSNRYSLLKIFISFLLFYYIFYKIFIKTRKTNNEPFTIGKYLWEKVKEREYWIILLLYTLLLYFVFNESTNLLVLLILIEVLRGIKEIFTHYKIEKRESKLVSIPSTETLAV